MSKQNETNKKKQKTKTKKQKIYFIGQKFYYHVLIFRNQICFLGASQVNT